MYGDLVLFTKVQGRDLKKPGNVEKIGNSGIAVCKDDTELPGKLKRRPDQTYGRPIPGGTDREVQQGTGGVKPLER